MSSPPPPSPTKPKPDGFWDSLSPEDQKKYTLVFLISIGTTLLVTGRTAGAAIKRSQTSSPVTPPTPSIPTLLSQSSTRIKKPKILFNSTPSPSPPRPTAPTASFLHPNSLTLPPSTKKRLLPSFVSPSSSSSSSSPNPTSPSSYFLPNTTLTRTSTEYATELDRQDKLHEDGEEETLRREQEAMLAEPGFNPAIYAAKALGIATAITFSVFGVAVWGTMKWLGVEDMEGLSLALSHRLAPALEASRPSLPSWAQPKEKSQSEKEKEEDRREAENETTKEELGYWREVKETLDREAEERRNERRMRWEGMRRRAGLTVEGEETKRV